MSQQIDVTTATNRYTLVIYYYNGPTMRSVFFSLALLCTSNSALAGGVGIFSTGGLHEVNAYYYRADGAQGIDTQNRPNAGFGAELLLGDKDDKMIGIMRGYWSKDAAPLEPSIPGLGEDGWTYEYPAAHEAAATHMGILTMGAQAAVWGDPSGTQVVVNALAGSIFATTSNLESYVAEAGVGATYYINEQLHMFGNVAFTTRYRKQISLGENAYAGVRYMFD